MVAIGDVIDIETFEYTGPAQVTHIEQEWLYEHHLCPIQCQIAPENLARIRSGYPLNSILRVGLTDIRTEAPPAPAVESVIIEEEPEEGQLNLFDF